VIIIGTGAGGEKLAYRPAPSGKHMLLLERGDDVPREKNNWNPGAINVQRTSARFGTTADSPPLGRFLMMIASLTLRE
jgi:hypothetical protein